MKTRFIALFLCAACLLCGCNSAVTAGTPDAEDTVQTSENTTTLRIAQAQSDTNPYLYSDVLTLQNAALLFEPLVSITPDMDLDYRLAYSIDNSGTRITVQLRSGCTFADGSSVTASDAAASLQAAQQSAAYSGRFSNVSSVWVEGSALCIELYEPDSLFAYLLDIPVLRADEVSLGRPTANGPYTYDTDTTLKRNSSCAFAQNGPAVIELVNTENAGALISGLAKSSIDLYPSTEGTDNVSSVNTVESGYRSNRLVYLGVNNYCGNVLCNTAEGRKLLSMLTDRSSIVSGAFGLQATVACGVLNSSYPCIRGQQYISASAERTGLEDTMLALGYTKNEDSGFYEDASRHEASVQILYCGTGSEKTAAALQLQEQWENAGIRVVLTDAGSYDAYCSAVNSADFELYIGEVKLYNDMDLMPFRAGSCSAGFVFSEALEAAYGSFRQNSGNAAQLEAVFAEEMPFIPLLWRSETAVCSRRISGLTPSVSSIFYSVDSLYGSDAS